MVVAVFAFALLPFGKNVVGTAEASSLRVMRHDVAWTMFVIKLGAWFYGFIVTCYFCVALLWASIVVVVVVVAFIVICMMACCAAVYAMGEGGGGLGSLECGSCHCGSCNCCEGATCDECCSGCCAQGGRAGPCPIVMSAGVSKFTSGSTSRMLSKLPAARGRRCLSSGQIRFGGVVVECEVGAFSPAQRIFNFEDYERNCCWICQDASSEWDMWNSCRHVFCKKCSSEMMRRRMPCPLCRVRSDQFLRRGAFGTAAGPEHGSGDLASSMLEQGDLVREPQGLVGAPNPISMPLVVPQARDDHTPPEEGDVQMVLH